MLRILVLGAAAGGGLPQWNCACECCSAAREGRRGVQPQTQSSIAVSADGLRWVVLNASPDIREQLTREAALHPRCAAGGLRHSPVSAVVLTNADIDHVAGLLTLRESTPFDLYATARVHETLAHDHVFRVLRPEHVQRRVLALEERTRMLRSPADAAAAADGIELTLFAVPGKVALYLEDPSRGPDLGTIEEDTVAVEIRDPGTGRRLLYVPGCAAIDPRVRERLRHADLLLFDGTVFGDDEMRTQGLGPKTGRRMGHVAMSGEHGSLEGLADLGIGRRVFIHINNSNPVWLEDSPERKAALEAGWEIAFDGMELCL